MSVAFAQYISTQIDGSSPGVDPSDLCHYRLAQALIYSAALDYHAYHCPSILRLQVHSATRRVSERPLKEQRAAIRKEFLRARASLAERWLQGADAPFPFSLAAHAVGWEPENLAPKLMASDAGERLYEKKTTPVRNRSNGAKHA